MSFAATDIFESPQVFEEYCATVSGRLRSRGGERAEFLRRSLDRLDSLVRMAQAVHDTELQAELGAQVAAIREELQALEADPGDTGAAGRAASFAEAPRPPAEMPEPAAAPAPTAQPSAAGTPLWDPFQVSSAAPEAPTAEPAPLFQLDDPALAPEVSATPFEIGDPVRLEDFETLSDRAPAPDPSDSMATRASSPPPPAAPVEDTGLGGWAAPWMSPPSPAPPQSPEPPPVMGTAVPMASPPVKDWDLDFRGGSGPAAPAAPASHASPFVPSFGQSVYGVPGYGVPSFAPPAEAPALASTASSGSVTPSLQLEITVGEKNYGSTVVGAVLVGRRDPIRRATPDIDLWPDDAVSRRHAEIVLREGRYFFADLGSTNGSTINGRAIPPRVEMELHLGDEISLGERSNIRVCGSPQA